MGCGASRKAAYVALQSEAEPAPAGGGLQIPPVPEEGIEEEETLPALHACICLDPSCEELGRKLSEALWKQLRLSPLRRRYGEIEVSTSLLLQGVWSVPQCQAFILLLTPEWLLTPLGVAALRATFRLRSMQLGPELLPVVHVNAFPDGPSSALNAPSGQLLREAATPGSWGCLDSHLAAAVDQAAAWVAGRLEAIFAPRGEPGEEDATPIGRADRHEGSGLTQTTWRRERHARPREPVEAVWQDHPEEPQKSPKRPANMPSLRNPGTRVGEEHKADKPSLRQVAETTARHLDDLHLRETAKKFPRRASEPTLTARSRGGAPSVVKDWADAMRDVLGVPDASGAFPQGSSRHSSRHGSKEAPPPGPPGAPSQPVASSRKDQLIPPLPERPIRLASGLAQTANSPESKLSRISTEASVGEVTKSVNSFQYEAQNLDVPVVVVTSEIHPWSKSGGLAIVAAQYAYNFAIRGHRTMAIAPMYDNYDGAFYQCTKSFELFGGLHEVHYYHHFQNYGEGKGCDYVFIEHPFFRRPGGLYHNLSDNQEYSDNLFRFALFSLAALEVPVAIELGGAPCYGGRVMFIANDWQTGLLPVYMVHRHRAFGNYNHARCMYVIHNLGYQGCYPLRLGLPGTLQYDNFAQLGLPFAALGDLLYQYPLHERTFEGDSGETLNLTKGAIQCCDRIVTVSPTYADEIRTLEGGFRLHDFVATKSYFLVGILNGIDASWAPEKDKTIAETFSAEDLSGKRLCKRHLQRKLGLKEDDDACILSFVGRLTSQKGIDLIGSCVHWIMEDHKDGLSNVQLVMMGNGEEDFGHMLRWAETTWKGRVCGYWGFSPQIEKEIIAGSDFFLMPSRYEPCGIPQMCAMLYGTIPIVHATGGLKDSVKSWYTEPDTSTGFHIWPLNEDSFKKVIFDGLHLFFREPEEFNQMRRRAMAQDFSWSRAIDDYERHFDWTIADPPFWGRP